MRNFFYYACLVFWAFAVALTVAFLITLLFMVAAGTL